MLNTQYFRPRPSLIIGTSVVVAIYPCTHFHGQGQNGGNVGVGYHLANEMGALWVSVLLCKLLRCKPWVL
jgi:hypothetical protein